MSYRRLFVNLLFGSTLALAGLWWLSLRNLYECIISPKISSLSLLGSFYRGTVGIGLNPYDSYRYQFMRACIPASSLHGQDGPMGRFGLGRVLTKGVGEAPGHYNYFLELPIWLIYIAFLLVAYTLIKLFERRSSVNREKMLAEQFNAESQTKDLPTP